jgi:hypothetical protein
MKNGFHFNEESLKRHKITRLEAVQIVESEESEYFPLTRYLGNDRLMFVGFSSDGAVLMEVGVEFLADGEEMIFHANKARRYFVNLYNARKQK